MATASWTSSAGEVAAQVGDGLAGLIRGARQAPSEVGQRAVARAATAPAELVEQRGVDLFGVRGAVGTRGLDREQLALAAAKGGRSVEHGVGQVNERTHDLRARAASRAGSP